MRGGRVKRKDVKRNGPVPMGPPRPDAALTFYVLRFTSLGRRKDRPSYTRPRSVPAFTLMEMLLTVALAAVLATVAAVSLAGAARSARARDAAGQVAHYDRLTREAARRFGRPVRLTFDLDRGTLRRSALDAEYESARGGPSPLHLPGGARIARLVSAGRDATTGSVSLPCSERGQTPSYAVLVAGDAGERQWLIVAGLTGNVTTTSDAHEVQDMFHALAAGADDQTPSPGDDAR